MCPTKKQYLHNSTDTVNKSRQPNFQKKPLNKIWAPQRLKLPVSRACHPRIEKTRFRRTCCFQKMGLTATFP